MFKNVIFDLDGTLLDTLPDIRVAINEALKECGYSYSFSLKEAKALIGNGTDILVKRALKDKEEDNDAFTNLKKAYLPLYKLRQNEHCKPYNGLKEALSFLSQRGTSLFVCTNKPDELAKIIISKHFEKDTFKQIKGNEEGYPVKPDPSLVNKIIELFSLKREETLFVGDSIVDVETARNANIKCCLVLWGYGNYKPALLKQADYIVKKPKEIVQVVLGKEGW
ncbi:MAG TPA: hypothetical protein DEF61_03215 [Firmicutes bacterium]|nr:hypothetical protein [Bacillota bacterium]HBM69919.1 hypothetical protein [Bacillota bacterium]HBX25265.1 hypothetical protein [Bacillota bacterium]